MRTHPIPTRSIWTRPETNRLYGNSRVAYRQRLENERIIENWNRGVFERQRAFMKFWTADEEPESVPARAVLQ